MKISHHQALSMILHHGQTLFGVKFVKEDGSIRAMSCKRHASNKAEEVNKTGRKQGRGRNFDPYKIKVWDMNKQTEDGKGAFRTINVRTLLELSIDGETFEIAN